MSETLLGTSRVFLFGRIMDDLQLVQPTMLSVRLVAIDNVPATNGLLAIDGITTVANDRVLLTKQTPAQSGIYTTDAAAWTRLPANQQPQLGDVVQVQEGSPENIGGWLRKRTPNPNHFRFRKVGPGRNNTNLGKNHQLGAQLEDASFARIYGFSYDGTYYDLPRPTLFLVHGEGELVTDPTPADNAARAPTDSTDTGLAASEFQFADKLMVWSYDKADYTIRMDVETGMFEQVLLDVMFGDGSSGGPGISGGRVSGGRVSGGRVSGGRVSGGRLRRGDPSD